MTTIGQYMSGDHPRCDDLFAEAEAAAGRGDWSACKRGFQAFHDAMGQHFAREETVLFPAFEARSGSGVGPTHVMRMEHEQMRELFEDMARAVQAHDRDAYLGLAETLLVLMQQHNLKEEQILYPMTEAVLAAEQSEVMARMTSIGPG